jgi:hypothetical protein
MCATVAQHATPPYWLRGCRRSRRLITMVAGLNEVLQLPSIKLVALNFSSAVHREAMLKHRPARIRLFELNIS